MYFVSGESLNVTCYYTNYLFESKKSGNFKKKPYRELQQVGLL